MSRRTAAALLITRGEGAERTVFLAERAPELRFFGGYWALPGGTVGDEDRAGGASDDDVLQACAHRELFEETGLLRHKLPPARTGGDTLGALREQLVARVGNDKEPRAPSAWPSVIAGSTPPPPLRALCRITTPPFAP